MNTTRDGTIAYEVVRSRRKTADIVLERDGRVTVRAPQTVGPERLAGIVEAKRYWVHKNLAEWRDMNATRVLREYRNGESFLYLGRAYRLALVSGQEVPLVLSGGRFLLRRDVAERGGVAAAQAAFRGYFIERGREKIARRVHYLGPKVGAKPASVNVRDLGNRWASCSQKGRLAFNWKCMMAPQTIIDYIVVHELCHMLHRDHTEAFWNEVDKVIPCYWERKEWLKRNGAALDV